MKSYQEHVLESGNVVRSLSNEERNIQYQLRVARIRKKKSLIERLSEYLDAIQESLAYHRERLERFSLFVK